MKICLVLHGKIGNIKGKHSQFDDDIDVLKLAYEHNKKHILDKYDTDVCIHTWSIGLREEIKSLYNPVNALYEIQKDFSIPSYINADNKRAFSHLSRWYSFQKSVELIKNHYDFVLCQRFDLCWNLTPELIFKNNSKFYVGKSTLNTNVEWSDRWFCSSLHNMQLFSTLYESIPLYMNGGNLPSEKQYKGISSHFLCKHHATQLSSTQNLFTILVDINKILIIIMK